MSPPDVTVNAETGRVTPIHILLVASFLGLIASGQHNIIMRSDQGDISLGHALAMGMPYWYLWALFFPLIMIAADRFPLRAHRWLASALAHLVIALVLTLLHSWLEIGFQHLVGARHGTVGAITELSFRRAFVFLPFNLVAYFAILGTVMAIGWSRRARQQLMTAAALRTQLAEANLHALRAQLNPHFLFNAMNSIAMLVRRQENPKAVTMIAGLSELLRTVLEEQPAQEVSLREELAFLRRYLELEEVRFPDRLRTDIAAPPEVLDAYVPNLILQPLVENALKHGISRRAQAGRLQISAGREGDVLTLRVTDDGPGLEGNGSGPPAGVGLRNVQARLELLYGTAQHFTLEGGALGGTTATIQLPWHLQPLPIGAPR